MAALSGLDRTRDEARAELNERCHKIACAVVRRGHALHPWSGGNYGLTRSTACRKCGGGASVTVTAVRFDVSLTERLKGRCGK